MVGEVGAGVEKTKASPRDLLTAVDGAAQAVIEKQVSAEFPDHAFLGEESVEPGQIASAAALEGVLASADWIWVVDPIDGTTNFASGMPLSAVSIGVAFRGEVHVGVIYDPFHDEMFTATRGGGAQCNGEKIRCSDASDLVDGVVFAGSPPALNSMAPSLRGIKALMPKVRTLRLIGSAAIMFAWVANGRGVAYFEADLNAWDVAAGALIIQEAGGLVTDLKTLEPFTLATRRILATNGHLHKDLWDLLDAADATELDDAAAAALAS